MIEVPEAFNRIDKFFTGIFEDKKNEFYEILKTSKALVSGGTVTKSLLENTEDWDSCGDVDIYVNAKNVLLIRDWLFSQSEVIIPKARASLYCNSFLKRNNIIKVQSLTINGWSFDLMHVRNKVTPLNVVENFDLTCCQNYFDGEKVVCLFPELTFDKVTRLNPEYMECLIYGNPFTRNRIGKYIQRGFSLEFNYKLAANYKALIDYKYNNNSFLGLSLNLNDEKDSKTFFTEYVRLLFYHSFFGVMHKMSFMYSEEVKQFIRRICDTKPSFENKIVIYWEERREVNIQEFADDGFDSDDFKKFQDYEKLDSDKANQIYTELVTLIKDYETDNRFAHEYKEEIIEYLKIFRN